MSTNSELKTPSNREIFDMSWPMAMRAVMMFSIVIIDLYLVSSLGEGAVASIGISSAISGLVMGTVFAFANAMQIKVAQAFGSENTLELKTAFYSGLLINSVLALAGIFLVVLFGFKLLNVIAHSPQIASDARAYLWVFLLVIASEAISSALTSFFNGCSRTKLSFYSFLLSAPVNVFSSIVLIFGMYGFPELGIAGAAWGSLIGAVMRMLYLLFMFYRSTGFFVDIDDWLTGSLWNASKLQFRFSWPIAATFVSMSFANQVAVAIYANLPIVQFAAITLILPWIRIAGQLSYTWTQATGILIAQLLGKALSPKALDEFLSRAWRGAFVAACIVAVAYAVIVIASKWIYSDLSEDTQAALLSFLPVLLLIPFPRVSNAICGNVLRASGDTKSSMTIHLGANWGFMVPMTALFVLVFDLSVTWVFALFLFEELVKFPFFHRRIWTKEWQQLKTNH